MSWVSSISILACVSGVQSILLIWWVSTTSRYYHFNFLKPGQTELQRNWVNCLRSHRSQAQNRTDVCWFPIQPWPFPVHFIWNSLVRVANGFDILEPLIVFLSSTLAKLAYFPEWEIFLKIESVNKVDYQSKRTVSLKAVNEF